MRIGNKLLELGLVLIHVTRVDAGRLLLVDREEVGDLLHDLVDSQHGPALSEADSIQQHLVVVLISDAYKLHIILQHECAELLDDVRLLVGLVEQLLLLHV